MSLVDGFTQSAARTPSRPAFVVDGKVLTYSDLEYHSGKWRRHLALIVKRRDCLGWHGRNDSALPALYLASTRLGRSLALMDSSWPREMLHRVCQQHSINELYSETALPDFSISDEKLLCTPISDQPDVGVDLPENFDSAPFLMGFTSGSSGIPKAFIRDQYSWKSTFRNSAIEFANVAAGAVLAPGPLSHGLSFYAMAETLNAGGTFYTQKKFNPQACLDLIASNCVTTLVLVPTMLLSLIQTANTAGTAGVSAPISGLDRIICAGAKLSSSLHMDAQALFPEAVISEYYGASELSFVSVSHSTENIPPASVGRAFRGVSISIRDETGAELPVGSFGKIYVNSDMLASGYLDVAGGHSPLDELNGAATVGDVGYLDARGHLYLTDRADNMLISGGLNIYPGEIEQVLSNHSSIADCVVLGIPDEYWGDRVVAVVRFLARPDNAHSGNEKTDSQSLKSYCGRHLPAYMVPRDFIAIDSWPLTSSGKINRLSVRSSCVNFVSGSGIKDSRSGLEWIDA